MSQEKAPIQKSQPAASSPATRSGSSEYRPRGGVSLPPGFLQYYGLQKAPAAEPNGDPAAQPVQKEKAEPGADKLQLRGPGDAALTSSQMHEAASEGVAGAGGSLPHLDAIQASFGHHDVSGVQAHTGTQATQAANAMGAEAYATGNQVAFGRGPDLHTAAHEAAHVVQQRGSVQLKGGIGSVGDSYEQHADAVADRVVQGRSASDLLDQMSPSGGTGNGSGGGVQHKLLQLDIKSDLRDAMRGWGSGSDKIFARVGRASQAEITAIVSDTALMEDLRKDLSKGDMERLVDQMDAPLPYKLRLAMRGWGNDNDYIMRSLQNANPTQLHLVLADAALMTQLMNDLGRDTAMQVMQRLNAPLKDKLKAAMKGWGRDENFMFQSLTAAPLAEVTALAGDRAFQGEIDGELSAADGNRFRAQMARRIYTEGGPGQAVWAFFILEGLTLDDGKLAARLRLFGSLAEQRALCDLVILNDSDGQRVRQAFQCYWGVECTAVSGASTWPVPTLQAIHRQMKNIPSQDTRSGVWRQLALTNDPALINRAAWGAGAGSLVVGSNASTTTGQTMGYATTLTANSAAAATTIQVEEGGRFQVNARLAIGSGANRDVFTVTAIAGNTYTVSPGLAHAHSSADQVLPDGDGTAQRNVNWLDATVRHEIAHSVETALGGVGGFQVGLGGWWTGNSPATEGDFDTWAAAMGTPWQTNDGSTIADADRAQIKAAITNAAANQIASLQNSVAATHPINANWAKNVPVIVAAHRCLSQGDNFFASPQTLYSAGGKRFSISRWYKKFMYHNDSIVADRVSDYQMYAPTEFFADAYTVFYEEAGRPGVTDPDYGRLIRNSSWRSWIRNNIHNRGQAPAGTGAATGGGPGAQATGASFGKSSHNSG